MAWLQNLAGRAEDLLNKIDQNAATVLNESTKDDGSEANFELKPDDATQEPVQEVLPELSQDHSSMASSQHSFIFEAEEMNETLQKTELENENLRKELLNLQHQLLELRNENGNLQEQLETSNFTVAAAQLEVEKYKMRTQRIFQEKEVKQNLPEFDNILIKHNEDLKNELEVQQDHNLELMEKVKQLSEEVSYWQEQMSVIQMNSQQMNQTLQDNLATERKIRLTAEEECRLKANDLQLKTQEFIQQYNVLQIKNQEIKELGDSLKQKTNSHFDEDLDARIKSLTNTLMVKQNALETVTGEKNALKIQLERLQSDYRNSLAQLERAQVRVVNVNDTDDVKSQLPNFMRVLPSDAGVTRRVKHAYSTVDAISVRTGRFLRQYPLARVLVFCYMVLLHFWVLVILFMYAPGNR